MRDGVIRLLGIKEAYVRGLAPRVALLCHVDDRIQRVEDTPARAKRVLLIVQLDFTHQAPGQEGGVDLVKARHDREGPIVATLARVPALVHVGNDPLTPTSGDTTAVVNRVEKTYTE